MRVARRQVEVVTCDLEEGDVSAAESLTFSFGGRTYTLDLCKKHVEEVRGTLERFAAAGHSTGGRGGRGRRRAARAAKKQAAPRGESQAAIREWARSAGYAVGDRGRIPGEVRAAYEAAQAKGGRKR